MDTRKSRLKLNCVASLETFGPSESLEELAVLELNEDCVDFSARSAFSSWEFFIFNCSITVFLIFGLAKISILFAVYKKN